jgi:cellulose synthase (UDP-forming)
VQLDADHRPSQGYLDEMLRPFRDPAVGYVSAPSLCDSNSATSWSARGRLYAEATLHGSLQAGYTSGWAPLCIGSHYAVRTHALHSIGGLGPELAEDHSTTLLMNAQGWKGVHAVNAIAHGDGPLTFADCMTQEFQWSRSLTVILLTLLPTHWRQLPLKLKCQFFFSELWYPLFGLTMLAGYSMPVFALLTDTPLVNVAYIAFIWHAVPVTLCVIVIVLWAKQCGWTRPVDAKVLSWESALFQLTRWPWILLGCGAGVVGVVTGKTFSFRVTPKVKDATYSMSLRLMTPYFGIIGITLISVLYSSDVNSANGYYYLALFNSAVYTIVVFFLAVNEMRITRLSTMLSPKHWLKSGIVTGLGLVLGISIAFRGDDALTGILYQGKANVEQIV